MDRSRIMKTFFALMITLQGCQLLSAAPLPPLSCNVTVVTPGGQVTYKLSHPPISPTCEMFWEDANLTTLADDTLMNSGVVANVTAQSITLWRCQDELHYRVDCLPVGMVETYCRVNCSALLDQNRNQTLNETLLPPAVTNTRLCFSESFCPEIWMVCVFLVGLFLPPMIYVIWTYIQRKRKKSRDYNAVATAAADPPKVQVSSV